MLKTSARLALAGALAASMLATTMPGHARDGEKTAAVIGGLLLGAAALSAASPGHRHEYQYAPPPMRVYRPPVAPFSPARGVVCYPREYACYNPDGDFLPTWTRRVF